MLCRKASASCAAQRRHRFPTHVSRSAMELAGCLLLPGRSFSAISNPNHMTDHLFSGLKVIDCASWIAGPAAATILSDFGADVIKIEPLGAGDPWRASTPIPGKPTDHYWQLTARNKRSLAVDL